MSELPPFMKTREEAIAYDIAEVIADVITAIGLLHDGKIDTIPIHLRTYIKPRLETIERLVGKRLEDSRKAYDDVIYACGKKAYELVKVYLTILAKRVCVEPYWLLAGSK
jgi:hypothetical protein